MNRNTNLNDNQIRIGADTQLQHATRYALSLFQEGHTKVDLAAIGVSIGKLVVLVEHLKIEIPGLYQQYFIGLKDVEQDRSLPYMKISLRLQDNFGRNSKGMISDPLPEHKRIRIYNFQLELAKKRMNETYNRKYQNNNEDRRYQNDTNYNRNRVQYDKPQPRKKQEHNQRVIKPLRKPVGRVQNRLINRFARNPPRINEDRGYKYQPRDQTRYDDRNQRQGQQGSRNEMNYNTSISTRYDENTNQKYRQEKLKRQEQGKQPIREKPQNPRYIIKNTQSTKSQHFEQYPQGNYRNQQPSPYYNNNYVKENYGNYQHQQVAKRVAPQNNRGKFTYNNRNTEGRATYENKKPRGNRNNYNSRRNDEYIESEEEDYEVNNYRQPKRNQDYQNYNQNNRVRLYENETNYSSRGNRGSRGTRGSRGSRGLRRGGNRQLTNYY